ncbi:MAG: preprotein translocase subunit SecG [Leptospiraceae bacterium]|nr:preprotein translocase subunit SecG [Leptospiraceae bacterium]NUM42286.1 preprotein translocase subunit SecG [Leptospiraceae bacterium]
MGFLVGTVLTLFIITSLFLIFMVLIQAGKGGGGGLLGGGASQTTFGASGGDVLTKITRYSAIAFILLAFLLSFLFAKKQESILPETTITSDPTLVPPVESKELPKSATPEESPKNPANSNPLPK